MTRLDAPGRDTWLAKALEERGLLSRGRLKHLLEEVRQSRPAGITLALVIRDRGLLDEETLERVLVELERGEPALPGLGSTEPEAEQLGSYRLLRRIGAGGMGVVYLAEHVETTAHYALKALPAYTDPDALTRFRREGESQARVDQHPNVVRIHSLGQQQGRLFLVMDLATGGSLEDRLAAGALPALEAARLVRDLARGLAHVHTKGILHRDLKPANILFDEGGTPMLVDFGLAKLAWEGSLTETDDVMGTPAYMAPEQVEGRRDSIGPATDVYGLGTVLYHCLTGTRPFSGGSALAVMAQVVNGKPTPPRRLKAGIPRALEAVCLKAMARQADQRQPSAEALGDELDSFLSQGTGPQSAPRRAWLFAAVSLLSVGVLAALWSGAPSRPDRRSATVMNESESSLERPPRAANPEGPKPSEAISLPSGSRLECKHPRVKKATFLAGGGFVSAGHDGVRVWNAAGEPRAHWGHAEQPKKVGLLAIPQRDQFVYLIKNGWVLASPEGEVTRGRVPNTALSLALSAPENLLAVGGNFPGVWLFELPSGKKKWELGKRPQVVALAFAFDLGVVAAAHMSAAGEEGGATLALWEVASRRQICQVRLRSEPMCMVYLPEAKAIAVGDGHGVITLFDAATGKRKVALSGKEVEGAAWGPRSHSGRVRGLAFAPGSGLFSVSGGVTQAPNDLAIWRATPAGSIEETGRFLPIHGRYESVDISPDGSRLLLTLSDRKRNRSLVRVLAVGDLR